MIRVLPGDVVSRIAAGEVIERPAAVVKELLENSLDAGSRRITVDIKEGGRALIRVTDDGEGIGRADLLLAFERHATSKLRSDQDLVSIRTMGFRGEALPSIAAVSKVRVVTATRQEHVGAQLLLVGGAAEGIVDAPPVPGTTVEVKDLFFNQPARKKFLKSVPTECSHIGTVLQQAALAWPAVHFRLMHNGMEIMNYPAADSDRDRMLQIYRPAFLDKTIDLRGRMAGCVISGVLIDPVHARSSRVPQDLFVNRRPVRNAAVSHAITDGYGSYLTKGCHPTYVIFLDIDPERIDVNVHPAKREIRFADQDSIHRFVQQSVRHLFSGVERRVLLTSGSSHDIRADFSEASGSIAGSDTKFTGESAQEGTGLPVSHSTAPLFVRETPASFESPSVVAIKPLGQMLGRYLVAQVGHELQVIDQHTAHERVLFQRLWRSWLKRDIAVQPLLIPEPLELTVAQRTLVQKYFADLERFGLVLETFGATALLVRAVPAGLGPIHSASLLQDLLEDLLQWDDTTVLEARAQPVLATLACQSAVKAGRSMALPEIERLVCDWVDEGLITTCPHGRRTAFRLSSDELDKLFGRAGWS